MTRPTTINHASTLAEHLTELLSRITVDNGFETDIGERVFRGRLRHSADLIPYSTLIEGDDTVADEGLTEVAVRQEYAVGAYLTCDPDNPNDAAHKAVRDIRRVLFAPGSGPGRKRLEGRVRDVRYLGRDIGPRSDGEASVFVLLRFEVSYTEKLFELPPQPPTPQTPTP